MLATTLVSTTILGARFVLAARVDAVTEAFGWLDSSAIAAVLEEPQTLQLGLSFSLPALFILLCHELGHWLACRRYGLPATPPFFLPAPVGCGTLGAFIRIRAPIRTKRELFDVGIAGPIAGFVALLPFLVAGIARSTPVPLPLDDPAMPSGWALLRPGGSLLFTLVSRLVHGPLHSHTVLELHPWALAAWLGLLATSLNLLPLAQLDGGHLLYALIGRHQRRLAPYLWGGLAAMGLIWPGWWLWSLIVLLIGLYHPPVWDESEPLDRGRRRLAVVALLLLVLTFMPVPIELLPVAAPS